MNTVVSWIGMVCIFILAANILKVIFNSLFEESTPARPQNTGASVSVERDTQTQVYKQKATGTYGGSVNVSKNSSSFNSYEEYRKNNRIAR